MQHKARIGRCSTFCTLGMVKKFVQRRGHQEFQVPKIGGFPEPYSRPFWGWVFPYISRIHTAYIGEYLHFRYLKCLVTMGKTSSLVESCGDFFLFPITRQFAQNVLVICWASFMFLFLCGRQVGVHVCFV